MHGEKLFDITDSFFHFNVCCIWDKYYEELFETLRARIDEYIIDIPNSFFYKKVTYERETVNYKYYLQRETKEQLQKIYGYLLALKSEGNCVMVRPHPLYSDSNQIKKLFSDIEIENPQTVDIKESILTTEAVISHYSTVLFQAYLNGIDVIIDNCSSSDNQCERLRSLGYIMMHLKHRCLKDILIGINAKRYNEKSN